MGFALMAIVDPKTVISYPLKYESLVISLKEMIDKKNPKLKSVSE